MSHRIALDVSACYGTTSGLNTYVRGLREALRSLPDPDLSVQDIAPGEGKEITRTVPRLIWENLTLPRLTKRSDCDLLHVPAFCGPWKSPVPVLQGVADIIGLRFPNSTGLGSRFYWNAWLPRILKRADHFTAISEYTRKDMIEHLGIPSERIHVTPISGHEGFERTSEHSDEKDEALLLSLGIRKPFFLFVGTFEPRKNLARTARAFLETNVSEEVTLILAGSPEFEGGEVGREILIEAQKRKRHILTPGYVSLEALKTLYRQAQAFLFPSLYEGFGLPVLEAMAAGCPVITSRSTSLPEVGGDAAYYVDPESVEDIARAMELVYSDTTYRHRLREKGYLNIRRFSWKKTAEATLQAYKKVLSHG